MPTIRRSKMKLTPEKVAALMASARRIDAEEAGEIKAKGREVFRRYDRACIIMSRLKAARKRRHLTLDQLAARTGIAKPNLSRLENSTATVPTLDTLERYALAVGYTVNLSLTPVHSKRQSRNEDA